MDAKIELIIRHKFALNYFSGCLELGLPANTAIEKYDRLLSMYDLWERLPVGSRDRCNRMRSMLFLMAIIANQSK